MFFNVSVNRAIYSSCVPVNEYDILTGIFKATSGRIVIAPKDMHRSERLLKDTTFSLIVCLVSLSTGPRGEKFQNTEKDS